MYVYIFTVFVAENVKSLRSTGNLDENISTLRRNKKITYRLVCGLWGISLRIWNPFTGGGGGQRL